VLVVVGVLLLLAAAVPVVVAFHEHRQRERYAQSEEGQQPLRERIEAEHALGRLKNRGAGTARYSGRLKTRGQWLWTAAVANLSLLRATQPLTGA